MKNLITFLAVAGLVLALAPAAQAASIVLMDPTTNDGSFESVVGGDAWAPTTSGIWTLTTSGGTTGLWDVDTPSYASEGDCCYVANGGVSGTATSSNLLGTAGYNTVRAGDEFTYSFDYRPNNVNQTFKFEIDFGNGPVELDSVTASSTGSYTNMSGTYTATATDAAGGELHVVLSIDGHSWTDNAQLSVEPAPAPATIVPITTVTTSGSIDLDSFTVGAVTYTTATGVVTGTSVKTDTTALNSRVIGNQDNFDLNLMFTRGGAAFDNAWTTSFVLGGANWSDANGDDADFFIFEANGNDTLRVAPIFTDDSVGQYVEITSSGRTGFEANYNWGNTGVKITGPVNNGQTIYGVAFAITDLKDAGGAALTNSTVIKGLAFDGPNTDIASISAVPAPDTDPAITSKNPDDEATDVAIDANLVATFDENIALTGSGTVTIRDLGAGADVVIDLSDHGGQVTVSGAVLTINPTADLFPGNSYAVRISADAVEDLATIPFAGILNDTAWNFDTAVAFVPVAGVTVVDIGVDAHSNLIAAQFPLRGTSDWNTSLTLDASGNAYAVFIDENKKNTVAKVTPGGVVTTQIIDTTDNDLDGHNTPSIAIDGDGFLHVAYNMHGAKFRPGMNMRKSPTAYSVAGVWTDENDKTDEDDPLFGNFTYPAMSTAPNGDVYMTIRNSTDYHDRDADGDPLPDNLFQYDTSAGKWIDRGDFAGEAGYAAYLPAPYVDKNDKVHLVWHWAEGGTGGIRHLGSYAVYDPIADTFSKADGTEYAGMITTATADPYQPREAAWTEKGISDHSVTVNALGQPIVAYNFFREGDKDQRVIRVARWDGSEWQRTDLEGPVTGTTIGDPVIVNRDGTLHIYYKDAESKMTLRSSVDNGLTFGDAITLTAEAVTAPHVNIGGTSIGDNQEAIFFMDENYATKMMFVDYAQVAGPDDTAPAITSKNPDDAATDVAIDANLVATFDEDIALTGSGTVTIRDLGPGSDVVINLPDAQVTVSGAVLTINPTADLLPGNSYAVRISADAVADLATNAFAGILNDTTWNFDTAVAVADNPFDNWLANLPAGQQSYDSDPDNDGIANLLEYAFGGDPTKTDQATVMPTLDTSGGFLKLTFCHLKASLDPNLKYMPEISSSLKVAWSTDGLTIKGSSEGVLQDNLPDGKPFATSDYTRVTVTADQSIVEAVTKQFLRISVIRE